MYIYFAKTLSSLEIQKQQRYYKEKTEVRKSVAIERLCEYIECENTGRVDDFCSNKTKISYEEIQLSLLYLRKEGKFFLSFLFCLLL